MCGINGFNFSSEELIKKMNNAVKHRGPDDSGFYIDENVSLGHQRLSIIDLSERGHQPMTFESRSLEGSSGPLTFEGSSGPLTRSPGALLTPLIPAGLTPAAGRLGPLTQSSLTQSSLTQSSSQSKIIVFNGEIYNFKEIKKELTEYKFKSDSDTEVILAVYDKWGYDCSKKLNGIFAFAIWDREKKELFLTRDRAGVKPLYYYFKDGKFIFSSEIKAILEHPDVKREVNLEALNHYFRVLYVPGPLAMFKWIKKLEPGHYLVLKDGKLEIKQYWDVCSRDWSDILTRGRDVIGREIQDLMLDSVKMQLVSDRPLGVFLSGGIDSTSVLGNMVKLGHQKIKTFSVGFDVKDPNNKFNTDFNLARKTAKHYNTDHHEFLVSSQDILENIEDVVWHLDEPICNTTQVATYLLSKSAKREVAVVLGGDGGDELFGGYERYRLSYLMSKFGWVPGMAALAKVFGKDIDYPKGVERYAKFMFQDEQEISRVLNSNVINNQITKDFYFKKYFIKAEKDFENQFMKTDFRTWLADESLMRTDKMTMAFGLEQRVPILDHRMAELAYQIPSKMKLGFGKNQTKLIWKQAMAEFLPEHVKESAYKKVWLTPMSNWLRYDLKSWVKEVLNKDYADTSEYINFREVQKMFNDHCEKRKYNLNLLWAVITFQIWWRKYMV